MRPRPKQTVVLNIYHLYIINRPLHIHFLDWKHLPNIPMATKANYIGMILRKVNIIAHTAFKNYFFGTFFLYIRSEYFIFLS